MSDDREVPHATPAPSGALCALHPTTAADGICARCGNYMCGYCSGQGTATECLACRERTGTGDFPFDRENWSLFALLDYAWQVFRHYWLRLTMLSAAMLIASQLVGFVLVVVPGFQAGSSLLTTLVLPGIVGILQMTIQIAGQLGLTVWSLRAIEAKPLEIDDLVRSLRRLPQALLVIAILGVPIVVVLGAGVALMYWLGDSLGVLAYALGGGVLLIGGAAATYVGLGLMFTTVALVRDESLDAWGAIRQSSEMVEGLRWRLFGAIFVIGLIATGGVMLCFVGLFPSLAYASLAVACVYNALRVKETRR